MLPAMIRMHSSSASLRYWLLPLSLFALPGPLRAQPGPAPAAEPAAPEIYRPEAPGFDLSRFVRFDGQMRLRYEFADPFSYAGAGVDQSDDAVFLRTRLGALFTLHRKLSARFQLQDSRIWGEEGFATATSPSGSVTTSIDNVDVHEAYIELEHLFEDFLGEGTLSLRAGRQELSFGDQRLVSPLDWSNVARAWDAARLIITPPEAPGGLRIDLFASIIRDTQSSDTGGGPVAGQVDSTDDKQGFHGLYAAFQDIRIADGWKWVDSSGESRPVLGRHQLDLYTFFLDLADGSFTAEDGVNTGDVEEVTLGLRGAGKLLEDGRGAAFDYSAEFAYQLGRFAGEDDIRAYGYALAGGYTFAGPWLGESRFRLGVEYDYASGDSNSGDETRETFDPLFPFGHYFQGMQDIFSWKNGQDLVFKLDLYPPKRSSVTHAGVEYHLFWLAERKDGWFNAGLGQIRRDAGGSSGKFVGSEIDVHFKYLLVPPFAVLWVGYSHFFPGEFVRETGDEPDRDFMFSQLAVTF